MKTILRGFILGLGLAACGERPLLGDGASDTDAATTGGGTAGSGPTSLTGVTTGGVSMGDPTTTTTTTSAATGEPVSTSAVSTSEDATSGGFIRPQDVPGHDSSNDCDGSIMPIQDCPEGQKCTFEGELWDTHCVDVVEDPKEMYEPCEILMGNWISGFDDCGPGLLCWNVDPDTGIGACIGLCLGPYDSPSCVDPTASCTFCQDCAMGLCLPGCDPLLQGCGDGDLCIPDPGDPARFICVLDASGDEGQVFDECEFVNACDPGLYCVAPALGAECPPEAPGCCLPFCDTTMPSCPGAGQECLPWFEMGQAPPGFENVGLCGVPS